MPKIHFRSYFYSNTLFHKIACVTHVGCECGSVSHVSQNKTQFMYNVYYKLNDAIHANNVQLFTHSSMRENYIITILDLYPLTFRLHTWHINPLVCKA